jgi:hypothetical protein
MSRRTSRLDTLLRVRRIQEEVSRALLAFESVAEREAQQTLEQAHGWYFVAADEAPAVPQSVQDFNATQSHRGALAGAVRVAGAGVETAAQVTLLARHEWSATAMRVTALERIEDRAREAARAGRLVAEQRTSEESSSARQMPRPALNAQGKRT